MTEYNKLIEKLIQEEVLKTPEIIQAFQEIKREDFLPLDAKSLASLDTALPIGYGQTISQPFVVAFMIERLGPLSDQKILDIGAGSGWTTALLAHIVGKQGRVVALEVIPELAEFGTKNVATYNFIEKGVVRFLCANGSHGYAPEAPYDGILVSASLSKKEIPSSWSEQLKKEGTIVAPIQESIWTFTKKTEGFFEEQEYPGFVFVPFVRR